MLKIGLFSGNFLKNQGESKALIMFFEGSKLAKLMMKCWNQF